MADIRARPVQIAGISLNLLTHRPFYIMIGLLQRRNGAIYIMSFLFYLLFLMH